jgi:hypothetical protein
VNKVAKNPLRAPIAGDVVNLKVTSLGAVMGPREPLLDIDVRRMSRLSRPRPRRSSAGLI